ncbi:NUDIX domain-containing protein [Sphingomonas sp. AOB5]|uniref:NUDIX domain-containing protein n=1 Tax=Sphingomonas sp. AOB5 TaxID=3034017 RepID=UPI0023F774DB|nr:NUDIX domain-containing protein [Sphingomonas sp. AOB5]MDF7777398.1 NUDIX domain-containing protein [Sphingomonas sp. AOB5]
MALAHRMVGKAARVWWFFTRSRTLGVRAMVLDSQGRVALVRHTFAAGWAFPGGGVKKGERFDEALARELHEEVAIADFAIERVLGVYHSRREYKDDHVVIFVVRLPAGTEAALAKADAMEIAEVGWFDLDALPEPLSPATGRRIAEYREGLTGTGIW